MSEKYQDLVSKLTPAEHAALIEHTLRHARGHITTALQSLNALASAMAFLSEKKVEHVSLHEPTRQYTDWFDAKRYAPCRVGVYQVSTGRMVLFSFWDGEGWNRCTVTASDAWYNRIIAAEPGITHFRGLRRPV